MITWESIGHFFASGWHDICVAADAVARHNSQIQQAGLKIEEIEAAVALVPGATVPAMTALEITRLSMFALGVACQLILAHGSAEAASQKYPEITKGLFTQAEQLMTQYPQLVSQAKGLLKG